MIIGTHNSGAYKIDLSKSFWPATNKFEIARRASCINIVRGKISSMVKNQKYDILKQLNIGCRAFDIRVSNKNKEFLVNHTYCCATLFDILSKISTFYTHTQTPIILIFRPDWETRDSMIGNELSFLSYVDNHIHFQGNTKIKCYFDFSSKFLKQFKNANHYNDLKMVWFNVETVREFEKQLQIAASKPLSNSVLNFVLTQSEDATILTTNLEEMAGELNPRAVDLIKKYIPHNLPKIILFDFVDENLIKNVTSLLNNEEEKS